MAPSQPPPAVRFIGLDVHKRSVTVGAVDAHQTVVLRPRRFSLAAFEDWAHKHLTATDLVALEATTNAWYFVDLLQPHVAAVSVAHPAKLKHITAARVKNDARDALKLAQLLAANLLPTVWVPPAEVRELRALITHRKRLVNQRTQARNRLQSVLHRHNLVPPAGKLFAPSHRAWWDALTLSPSERLRVRQDLALFDYVEHLVADVEAELAQLSAMEPWVTQMPFLVQLPGFGGLTAITVLAAIGDVRRFATAKHLVGYSGLGASVSDSGDTHRSGKITKEGRRELRAVLIEAAWVAVEHHPHWHMTFERLAARIGKPKAIVAIARKLLVAVWYVLTHRQVDCHGDVDAVARKLMNWATRYRLARRCGMKRGAFVRWHLDQLGIGMDVDSVLFASQRTPLPPSTRLLAPP